MVTRIDLSELAPEEAWRELLAILRNTPTPPYRPAVTWSPHWKEEVGE
jgi:hypothetical protein